MEPDQIPGQQAQSELPDTPTFEEYADYQEEKKPDNYRWQDGLNQKVLTQFWRGEFEQDYFGQSPQDYAERYLKGDDSQTQQMYFLMTDRLGRFHPWKFKDQSNPDAEIIEYGPWPLAPPDEYDRESRERLLGADSRWREGLESAMAKKLVLGNIEPEQSSISEKTRHAKGKKKAQTHKKNPLQKQVYRVKEKGKSPSQVPESSTNDAVSLSSVNQSPPAQAKPHKKKSSQQLLRERYENGDPEVGLLGEHSGKFDYYVLYPRYSSLDHPPVVPTGWDTDVNMITAIGQTSMAHTATSPVPRRTNMSQKDQNGECSPIPASGSKVKRQRGAEMSPSLERTLSLREWLSEARLEDPHAFEFPSVNMINGDEQRSTAAKRKATAPVGGIFQKKKRVRIGESPVHQIESDLEQLKGQMKERLFSIKNGILLVYYGT